jgi:hypothetical protein
VTAFGSRKQTVMGPYVAPLLKVWRDQLVHPVASKTTFEACRPASRRVRSAGEAWVESLELRNVTCMVTRTFPTLAQGAGEQAVLGAALLGVGFSKGVCRDWNVATAAISTTSAAAAKPV